MEVADTGRRNCISGGRVNRVVVMGRLGLWRGARVVMARERGWICVFLVGGRGVRRGRFEEGVVVGVMG